MPAGQVLAMFGGIGVSEYRAKICVKFYELRAGLPVEML
jgi:hypothetical protein